MKSLHGADGRCVEMGFSLVELMLVIGIIGILTTMAIPKFQSFLGKAKQSEAKTNMAFLNVLQESYYMDTGSYFGPEGVWVEVGKTSNGLGFKVDGRARYMYQVYNVPGYGGSVYYSSALALTKDIIVSGCRSQDNWWYDSTNKVIWAPYDCVTGFCVPWLCV